MRKEQKRSRRSPRFAYCASVTTPCAERVLRSQCSGTRTSLLPSLVFVSRTFQGDQSCHDAGVCNCEVFGNDRT